jgi:hypothetical protein
VDRAEVVDVAVGRDEVQPAVGIQVGEADAEPQEIAARRGESDDRGVVGELAGAEVVIEGRGLPEEVGDRQVGPAIAVQVAGGDPHAREIASVGVGVGVGGQARELPLLAKAHTSRIAEEPIGRRVVGDEQVDRPVFVQVDGDDPQSAPVLVHDARFGGHVDEPAGVVAEQVVGRRLQAARLAIGIPRPVGVPADLRVRGIPAEIVADVEIQVAVADFDGDVGQSRSPSSPARAVANRSSATSRSARSNSERSRCDSQAPKIPQPIRPMSPTAIAPQVHRRIELVTDALAGRSTDRGHAPRPLINLHAAEAQRPRQVRRGTRPRRSGFVAG